MGEEIELVRRRSEATLEDDVCIHVFRASAHMVGVCITIIGVFRVGQKVNNAVFFGDALLFISAMSFLASCILSYTALRTRRVKRRYRVERVADVIFFGALCLMALTGGLIAYEFI